MHAYSIVGTSLLVVAVLFVGYALFAKTPLGSSSAGFLVVVVGAKLAASWYRYDAAVVSSESLSDSSDTYRYLAFGREAWLSGGISLRPKLLDGTEFMVFVSRNLYALWGDNRWLVFLTGSLMGLIGTWLMLRALMYVVPVGRGFGLLVCLFPSSLYWLSSFGKEPLSHFFVGLAILGWVRLVCRVGPSRRALGHLSVGVGVAGTLMVRPEIGILLVVALAVARLSVRVDHADGAAHLRVGRLIWLGALAIPVVVASKVVTTSLQLFSTDLTTRYDRTSLGQAQVDAIRAPGLLGLVEGVPTMLLRPFPWELGLNGFASSLDTVILLVLLYALVFRRWRFEAVGPTKLALGVLLGVLVLGYSVALVGYGNLGLMVRMRSLMIVLCLLLLKLIWTAGLPIVQRSVSKTVSVGPRPKDRHQRGRERHTPSGSGHSVEAPGH